MTVRIINADVIDGLKQLPDESVNCVVTSPPYWGLRDYGTATWEGGDSGCDHLAPLGGGFKASGLGNYDNGMTAEVIEEQIKQKRQQYRDVCGKCGAKRVDRQIGLEKTPAEFVSRMVEVFREVRRVLRSDGVCFVNLGDSYVSAPPGNKRPSESDIDGAYGRRRDRQLGHGEDAGAIYAKHKLPGLKQKDLVGAPWRVAFALQDDGWWLRQDIIWAKPNPMPESVTDRCTKAHEYVFLLTKSARYFYDAEAISEPSIYPGDEGYLRGPIHEASDKVTWRAQSQMDRKKARQNVPKGGFGGKTADSEQPAFRAIKESRNKRSVWTISTNPFPEAHFATFPPELPELCIKAGCPKGGTVLDPFGGAGTTGLVADRLQRHAILIELNPEYAAMAQRRINGDRGGLLDVMEAAE